MKKICIVEVFRANVLKRVFIKLKLSLEAIKVRMWYRKRFQESMLLNNQTDFEIDTYLVDLMLL